MSNNNRAPKTIMWPTFEPMDSPAAIERNINRIKEVIDEMNRRLYDDTEETRNTVINITNTIDPPTSGSPSVFVFDSTIDATSGYWLEVPVVGNDYVLAWDNSSRFEWIQTTETCP